MYTNPKVKFRIPFPWTGWYYSINTDEVLPGRRWLCFFWWTTGYALFIGIAFIAYFPAQREVSK
jgi:hypothetical protein